VLAEEERADRRDVGLRGTSATRARTRARTPRLEDHSGRTSATAGRKLAPRSARPHLHHSPAQTAPGLTSKKGDIKRHRTRKKEERHSRTPREQGSFTGKYKAPITHQTAQHLTIISRTLLGSSK